MVRKHQEKALYGTILDYRHREPQLVPQERDGESMLDSIDSILADVELIIRVEGDGRWVLARTENVVERTYVAKSLNIDRGSSPEQYWPPC